MKNGIYIYGVISRPQEFEEIGIGGKNSQVFTIGFKDLAAVVSKTSFKDYDSLAKEETVKDLTAHQSVIEKVMENFTIIPVKFGTMVEAEDDLAKFLDEGGSLLSDVLRKMEGRMELDLVVSWELPKILPEVYRESSRIRNKQQEIATKGDRVTIEDKIALGRLVEQELKTKKTGMNNQILQTLKKQAEDVCLHDLATDEMIFNAAFLIKTANREKFHKTLDQLDQKFEESLNFRLVGPLPPYSFSTILFRRISQPEVEEAQKTLGLNGEITDRTVKDAYRQLAQKYHPDKNAGQTQGTQSEFDLINSAYRTLKDFTQGGFFNVEIYRWKERG